MRQGTELKKAWVCLFTCLTVRAIHLEWVLDLTAIQFLSCLRRFVSCRGKPDMIISDNAPQFRLTKTTLDEQWRHVFKDEDVLNYVSMEGIKWSFATALAPWQGGFYERLIGMVKWSLRKAMGKKRYTLDQLVTLLTEIEAVVNSRTLTYVYGDFESGFTLTPSHFLAFNRQLGLFSSNDNDCHDDVEFHPHEDAAVKLIENWRKGQRQLDMFWKVWKDEYLMSLREKIPLKHKQFKPSCYTEPIEGSVVIVKDDNLPRSAWKIGKILRLITSRDSKIRSAEVKLPSQNIISRPINHLYPLELPMKPSDKKLPENVRDNDVKDSDRDLHSTDTSIGKTFSEISDTSTPRKAFVQARKAIHKYLNDEFTTVLFCFPRECRDDD